MSIPILIVDDSSLLRTILSRLLPDDKGIEITQACNGEDAIEKILNNHYRLIFLDLHMPEMDGYQVLEQLQAADNDQTIIAASADFQPGAIERAFNMGVKGFIKKPFEKEEIDAILHKNGII
jgi:CheY-like chemotaxis protein